MLHVYAICKSTRWTKDWGGLHGEDRVIASPHDACKYGERSYRWIALTPCSRDASKKYQTYQQDDMEAAPKKNSHLFSRGERKLIRVDTRVELAFRKVIYAVTRRLSPWHFWKLTLKIRSKIAIGQEDRFRVAWSN